VDGQGWLWYSGAANRLWGHHLATARCRQLASADLGGRWAACVLAWRERLVVTLGRCPYYVVVDPSTGSSCRHPLPAPVTQVTDGVVAPDGECLLLFDRDTGQAVKLHAPETAPKLLRPPCIGTWATASWAGDGLVYMTLAEPARLLRLDPASARFAPPEAMPWPEAIPTGRFEHQGRLWIADTAAGRLLPLDLNCQRWLEPVPIPGVGADWVGVGAGFGCRGQGYFQVWGAPASDAMGCSARGAAATAGHSPRPAGCPPGGADGLLVFDPEVGGFDYLAAPPQPDGVPLLGPAWSDGTQFAVTGVVAQVAESGGPAALQGTWFVLQSQPAVEPGFDRYDLNWDRSAHLRRWRRGYPADRSLYLPEPRWSPPVRNLRGGATQYPPGRAAQLNRRADRTDRPRYWSQLADDLLDGIQGDAARVARVAGFVQQALYYNPIQALASGDPIAILESHDGRCGQGVAVTLELLGAAGVEARRVNLCHHTVAEARYDGAWHVVDALFFGACQPNRDGWVLGVEDLQREPYWADAWPQSCFAYDEELLRSEDGYQILGYCFGPWGSEPFYSYYLGAAMDHPPTLPMVLPAARHGTEAVRLRWCESIRRGGGPVEYRVRIWADRQGTQSVFAATTTATELVFEPPESHYLYYVHVQAVDEHRQLNVDTWYPAARGNLVLVPEDQYGWYGVL
jgi:hypothetical protein